MPPPLRFDKKSKSPKRFATSKQLDILTEMRSSNQSYIDQLRLDLGGLEYAWMRSAEAAELLPLVGQLMVTLYYTSADHDKDVAAFAEGLERAGMRLFFQELHRLPATPGDNAVVRTATLGFIRLKWNSWDRNKLLR